MQQFNQVIITIGDNKLAIKTESKTFNYDLPKMLTLNENIKFIIKKHNERLDIK